MIYFPSLQATDDPILLDLRVGTLLEEEDRIALKMIIGQSYSLLRTEEYIV